jgi:hypothetical protein
MKGDERWAMHVFEGRRILWKLVITSRSRQFVRTRRGTWFDGSSLMLSTSVASKQTKKQNAYRSVVLLKRQTTSMAMRARTFQTYGVPGEPMSNIHANNIQHSKKMNGEW